MLTREEADAILSQHATTIEKAGALLGISRAHAYKCADAGYIPTLRLGGKRVVPVSELRTMLKIPAAA
jgi:excisionase family DNA binding protein